MLWPGWPLSTRTKWPGHSNGRSVRPAPTSSPTGPGRVQGRGYVHENEAASEILEELLQPELDDLSRRAALGLHDAAGQLALGLLRGLANCHEDVDGGTVLAYAGPDMSDDLAWSVRDTPTKAGLKLPDEVLEDLSPDSDS